MIELKPGNHCPLLNKECIQLQCSWFTQVRGVNPNTGKEVDNWSCAVSWLPVLLIENSQQQRSTSAAVENFRNEFLVNGERQQNVSNVLLQMLANRSQINQVPIQQIEQKDEE